jgi:uncharacterized protein (TIGR01777 family)
MKVVVAGGTGFIGSALVRGLKLRGYQLVVLTRNAARAGEEFTLGGIEPVEWHPPELGPWVEAIDGADAVVNLAGIAVADPAKPWTAAYKRAVRDSRVDSTTALVEAIRRAGTRPRLLINQSAIGYYGSQGDTLLDESSPAGSDFLAGVVKDWEAAAQPVEELGVRLVILRTGLVLGRDGGILQQFLLPFKLHFGGVMGMPNQWVSWIHLEDEIELILFALDREEIRGVLNATAPNPVQMKQFSAEIGEALGRRVWVPLVGVGMKVVLGQRANVVLASQRVIPRAAIDAGYLFRHAQSGESIRNLLSGDASTGGQGGYIHA